MSTLVLDIDETIVHSWPDPTFVDDYNIYTQHFDTFYPPGKDPLCYSIATSDFELNIWGLFRPHYREFITFVSEYFDNVIIWSAGSDTYVREVTKILFSPVRASRYPKIVHSRSDCVYDLRKFYHKPLRRLIANSSHLPLTIDLKRSLILDDKPFTFKDNPGHGVLIPPFNPGEYPTLEKLLDRSDTALLTFIDWVKKNDLRNVSDFSVLKKDAIFD